MNRRLTILSILSALLGAAALLRPRSRLGRALLWLPKLLGGALAPLSGLAARLLVDLPDVDKELAALPSLGGPGARPPAQPSARAGHSARTEFERNRVVGHDPESGRALLADLWLPSGPRPSGLGLIYAHGSGWRVGGKDMGTRPFFRRLAGQGHLVLDLAYTLWPSAALPAMVAELNQAILWLKDNGPAYGVDPGRIALVGASAGAHLALLAAYTPGHPAFRPAGSAGDTSVRGVVAFYPPVDLLTLQSDPGDRPPSPPGWADRIADGLFRRLFMARDQGSDGQPFDLVAEMLGGTAAEIPDDYRLLSPCTYVCDHCPPTLLIQGSDDVFGLAPAVRRLHDCLRAAGVTSVLLEFPHTDHGFDLLLPRISPAARAATHGVEQFLAGLE